MPFHPLSSPMLLKEVYYIPNFKRLHFSYFSQIFAKMTHWGGYVAFFTHPAIATIFPVKFNRKAF